MAILYRVSLTDKERAQLRTLIGSGIALARMLTHTRVLRKADHGEGGRAGPMPRSPARLPCTRRRRSASAASS